MYQVYFRDVEGKRTMRMFKFKSGAEKFVKELNSYFLSRKIAHPHIVKVR